MKKFLGIEYGRAATATITDKGPALAPRATQQMFPDADWTFVTPDAFNLAECMADRFGENFKIQRKIYSATTRTPHILVGGDHSVNFGHFAALADQLPDKDLCLVYIDAHLDIHTPETSRAQASGAPHGTNVRALLGEGDARWMTLPQKKPSLLPKNLFYIGTRAFEPAEHQYITDNNIYVKYANEIQTLDNVKTTVSSIRNQIGNRPFVVSFDFDAIDPKYFSAVLVPEPNGISVEIAKYLIQAFSDAYSFEFVEYAPNGDTSCAQIVHELVDIVYSCN